LIQVNQNCIYCKVLISAEYATDSFYQLFSLAFLNKPNKSQPPGDGGLYLNGGRISDCLRQDRLRAALSCLASNALLAPSHRDHPLAALDNMQQETHKSNKVFVPPLDADQIGPVLS
jgi:hypothetical protein